MSHSIIYAVNDHMYDFFVASQESRLQHAPESPCYVIPFSDDFERIASLAGVFNFEILQTDLRKWDALGEMIWGHMPHRPNVEKKSYFRKLAMFEAPTEHFLFVDANTVFTDQIEYYINLFEQSGLDISFLSYSLPGRNFQHGGLIDMLDLVNPEVRHGFNCGFVLGRQDLALYDSMRILAAPGFRLQRIFGGAPEQAFLAYVAGLTGKKMARFIDILPQATTELNSEKPLIQRGGNTMFGAKSRTPGKRVFFLKWNGAKLHEGLNNFEVLDRYHKAGLARIAKA
jgi:hypothetical protein